MEISPEQHRRRRSPDGDGGGGADPLRASGFVVSIVVGGGDQGKILSPVLFQTISHGRTQYAYTLPSRIAACISLHRPATHRRDAHPKAQTDAHDTGLPVARPLKIGTRNSQSSWKINRVMNHDQHKLNNHAARLLHRLTTGFLCHNSMTFDYIDNQY